MSNNLNQLINTFTLYKFIKDITTPYNKMKLYDNGLIDETGEIIDSTNLLPYDHLILSIKKLLKQIPNPNTKAKLKNLTTAISLFSEDIEKIGGNKEVIFENIMNFLEEETSVGAGGISGVSPNPENINDLPDTFLSKNAQKKYTKAQKILRRKRGY
jgi:hypothetical protein